MRRREFIAAVGGAVAIPFAARAQQALPIVGYLGLGTRTSNAQIMGMIRQNLADAGFIEGRTVIIEPRWADGDYSRLPALAKDLVRRQAAVIIATGGSAPAVPPKQRPRQYQLFLASQMIQSTLVSWPVLPDQVATRRV